MTSLHARMRLLSRRRPMVALIVQVALLAMVWFACDTVVRALHLPIPGSVGALALVLALLAMRVVPETSLRCGADWLLADMLLFFIPAVMAVWEHLPLLRSEGLRIVVAIVLGTVMVMATTAGLVDLAFRWKQHRAR